jgi:hypothetical protein
LQVKRNNMWFLPLCKLICKFLIAIFSILSVYLFIIYFATLYIYICLFYLNLSIYLLSQNILNDFFAVARRSVCPGPGVDQAELLPQRHHLRSLHHPTSSQEQGNNYSYPTFFFWGGDHKGIKVCTMYSLLVF